MFKEVNKNCKRKVMEREFAPYTEALELKELGFDEPCFGLYYGTSIKEEPEFLLEFRSSQYYVAKGYVDGILAPTYSQAFRFFREKYGYCSYIKEAIVDDYRFYIEKFDEKYYNSSIFKSYEEAELECLKKLIQIVKEK